MAIEVMPLKEYQEPFKYKNTFYKQMSDSLLKHGMVADLSAVDPNALIIPLTVQNIGRSLEQTQIKAMFDNSTLRIVLGKLGFESDNKDVNVAGILIENKNTPLTMKDLASFYYTPLYYDADNLALGEYARKVNPDAYIVEAISTGTGPKDFRVNYKLHFLGTKYSIPNLIKMRKKINTKKFLNTTYEELNRWLDTYETKSGGIKAGKKRENYDRLLETRNNLNELLATPDQISEILA